MCLPTIAVTQAASGRKLIQLASAEELDVDRVGSLTILGFGFLEVQQSRGEMQSPLPRKAQFEVMSLPNRIFRLSNGESEPDGIQQIMRECLLGLY